MSIGWINSPERWTDVFIMAFATAGTILFLLAIVFMVIIGLMTISLLKKAKAIMTETVQPTMQNVQGASESMRGTASFVSESVVMPVLKVYGAYAGARRFLAVFARLTRGRHGR